MKKIFYALTTFFLIILITGCDSDHSSGSSSAGSSAASLVVGDTGPAGGIIIHDKGSVSDGWRYIEAAPAETEGPAVAWGHYGVITYASGLDIGTGKANTEAIPTSPAAQACLGLVYGGCDDWYLPSIRELEAIAAALSSTNEALPADASYWSSTEIVFDPALQGGMPGDMPNSYEAYAQVPYEYSSVPVIMNMPKTDLYRVRAVRYF